jgi:hypothetical protein
MTVGMNPLVSKQLLSVTPLVKRQFLVKVPVVRVYCHL